MCEEAEGGADAAAGGGADLKHLRHITDIWVVYWVGGGGGCVSVRLRKVRLKKGLGIRVVLRGWSGDPAAGSCVSARSLCMDVHWGFWRGAENHQREACAPNT